MLLGDRGEAHRRLQQQDFDVTCWELGAAAGLPAARSAQPARETLQCGLVGSCGHGAWWPAMPVRAQVSRDRKR